MVNSKLLIVEDERSIAYDLQKRISEFGYTVVGIVSTGEEAVEKVIATSPDLVLMDVQLKGKMDGIDLATMLRSQLGVAVVYISEFADNETLKRASKTEPMGFILKPIEERTLRTTLEMALCRRELEKRFKENETWYGTTLKSIGEAVIATDANGAIKFMNAAAESLTGWKSNEVLGEDFLKVFRTKEKSEKKSDNPVNQILKNKITAILKDHSMLLSRENREIPIEESVSPIKDEIGNIVGVVIVFQDVLERKRTQEALRTSQDYAQSIIESSMDMVIAVDLDRKIIEFNKAAERTFGYKKEEILGKHINILYADPEVGARINQQVDELGREVIEVKNKRKNGEIFPCILVSSVLKSAHGEKIGYMGMSRDITEVKRAEERLKAAQEYAHNIVNSSLDMIIAVDKNRTIVEFNKAAEDAFGYEAKEVLGKHVSILYADPEVGMNVHKITIEKGHYIQEVLNRRKNGESFPSFLSSSVLLNAKGEMIGVMGVSRDFTEKKRAEQALRESEERYRALVELCPDPIAVFVGGKFAYVNASSIEIFGASSANELLGRSMMDMIHPDYRVAIKDQISQIVQHRKRVPIIEQKFFRVDGTMFEAEVAAIPFSWQGSSAIQVVLRDVTERRRAEQVIRGSEAKYRSLIENVLDGVYQTTPDGEILTANPALARMLGYESETDLLLLNVEKDLYANPDERRQYLRLLNKGTRIKNAEFKLKKIDGQVITVLENGRIVRNKLGDILYYEGTITDINELKLAQEALQISEERFRMFIEQSAEAIWCFESPEPMSINLTEERQIKYLMETDCLTECNNSMARMYGFNNAGEILGKKLKDFLDPTDPKNIEYLRLFIRSNYRLVNTEIKNVDKEGRPQYLLNNMIGILKGDRLQRVWGTQRDITLEKQHALRLTASEEKFRTVTESVTTAIVIVTDGIIQYANPSMEKLTGYSKEELLAMTFKEIVHPDFQHLLPDGGSSKFGESISSIQKDLKIITKKKEERWIDLKGGMTVYDGQPAWLATAVDSTEQKNKIMVHDVRCKIAGLQDIRLSFHDLFTGIYTLIREITPAQNLIVAILQKGKKSLQYLFVSDDQQRDTVEHTGEAELMQYVFKTGNSFLCSQFASKELKRRGQIQNELISKIWLGIPLSFDSQIIGVLAVYDHSDTCLLSINHQHMLENIAAQIARVINNKCAFENLRQHLECREVPQDEMPKEMSAADTRRRSSRSPKTKKNQQKPSRLTKRKQ